MIRVAVGAVFVVTVLVGVVVAATASTGGFQMAASEGMRAETEAVVVEARNGISGLPRPASNSIGRLAGAETPTRPPAAEAPETVAVDDETAATLAEWNSAEVGDEFVRAALPSRIVVDAIGLDAAIVATGIDADGAMAIPPSPDVVGWYRFGSLPGDDRRAVLAGHVDAAGFGPGAFYDIDRLATSDRAVIHFDDGSTRTFEVSESVAASKLDLDLESLFGPAPDPLLTLVTCGGDFDSDTGHYEDNVVVTLSEVG
jgi:hypothetical protein